jgi:hypothetical protein
MDAKPIQNQIKPELVFDVKMKGGSGEKGG